MILLVLGSYKQMGINENGKYPSSELCNSIQNRFSGSERFKYAYNKNLKKIIQ